MKVETGGHAPPVHVLTERQADQRLVEQMRADSLAAADRIERVTATEVRGAMNAAFDHISRAVDAHTGAILRKWDESKL